MEAVMKKKQTSPFGNWDIYDGIPVSGERVFQKDVDLFKVPQPPQAYNYHKRTKVAEKKHLHHQEHRKKQRRVCCPVKEQQKRVPKVVDEDLYKIPSEFLNQKPKSRVVSNDFWKRCLGLSCIS